MNKFSRGAITPSFRNRQFRPDGDDYGAKLAFRRWGRGRLVIWKFENGTVIWCPMGVSEMKIGRHFSPGVIHTCDGLDIELSSFFV